MWGAEVHLGFTRVSLAQFFLNISLIFSCQNFAASHEETAGDSMSDGERLQAEFIYIKESVEGGAGNKIQPETGKCEVSTSAATLSMSRADSEKTRWCLLFKHKCG